MSASFMTVEYNSYAAARFGPVGVLHVIHMAIEIICLAISVIAALCLVACIIFFVAVGLLAIFMPFVFNIMDWLRRRP